MTIFNAILITESMIIGLFLLLLLIGNAWQWLDRKRNPHYPFSDIDPMCHPSFVRDKYGRGWIGKHQILT